MIDINPVKAIAKEIGGSFGRAIEGAFRRMDIAEYEIKQAIKRHPNKATILDNSFLIMKPSDILLSIPTLDDRVYRHHCRELLERVASGESVVPGTVAEILIVLVHSSLSTSLDNANSYLYGQMFIKIYGIDKVNELFKVGVDGLDETSYSVLFGAPPWKGYLDEAVPRMRKKTESQTRKEDWEEVKNIPPRFSNDPQQIPLI